MKHFIVQYVLKTEIAEPQEYEISSDDKGWWKKGTFNTCLMTKIL